MEKEKTELKDWHIVVCFLIGVIWGLLIHFGTLRNVKTINFDKGHKQGQIDALNGIQNYDRIITKDTIYIKIR